MADIALDGTEFFRSRHIHCPNCSTRKRSDGATEHFHSMLAAKPGSHTTLYEYLHGIDLPTRRAASGKGARMSDLPIRGTGDALRVNWLEIEIARPNGTVTYRGSFIASLPVNRDNVAELAETLWQRARLRLGARQRLFEHLRSITAYHVFPTWTALMTPLATGHAPPQPP